MVTLILGLFGFLHLIIPKKLRDMNVEFMEMQGWEPDEDRFIHSLLWYRILGGVLILFGTLHFFKVIDFSFLLED